MRRLRVLVADDHEVHRTLLGQAFRALGCVVTTVCDGAAALAAKGPFDLICLDRHMPGPDGDEVARRLRGQAILVACTSDPSRLDEAFDLCLPKPVDPGRLVALVQCASQVRVPARKKHAVAMRHVERCSL